MEEEQSLPVDADDLRLIEEAHPGHDKCPTCNYDRWYVIQGPGMVVPLLPQGNTSGLMLMSAGHPLVAMACQRCGYVKTYIKAIMDAYVKHLKEDPHGSD